MLFIVILIGAIVFLPQICSLTSLLTSKGIVDDYLRSLNPYDLGEQLCKVRFPNANVIFPKMGSEGVLDFLNSNAEYFDGYRGSYYPIEMTDKKFKKILNGEQVNIRWHDLTAVQFYRRDEINLMDQYVALRFINKGDENAPLFAIAFRRHKHRFGKVVKGGYLDILEMGSFEQISQVAQKLEKTGNI